jgi:hypothetical protein
MLQPEFPPSGRERRAIAVVVVHPCGEARQGAREQRARRGLRAPEAPRGLGVREAREPHQHDDLAPSRRQLREGALEALELLARDRRLAGRGGIGVLQLVRLGRLLVGRVAPLTAPEAPAAGQLVLGRACEPAPEARGCGRLRGGEAVHPAERLAQHGLHHVAARFACREPRSEPPAHEAPQPGHVSLEQLAARDGVARQRALQAGAGGVGHGVRP